LIPGRQRRAAGPVIRRGAVAAALLLLVLPITSALPLRFSEPAVAAFTQRYGLDARTRLLAWSQVMEIYYQDADEHKRRLANEFFNRIPWVTDQDHWGKLDYWATPSEMIGTNGGDCEDYSIGKYFTLTAMRIPRDRLLITYVRAPQLKIPHMVLAYYATPDADPLILDNLVNEILPGSQRSDLIPVYSFNTDGLWMAVQRGQGRRVGSVNRLNLWRDLMQKMERDEVMAELLRAL
jgi:predicted transglutaminase-like cysteine proteinase